MKSAWLCVTAAALLCLCSEAEAGSATAGQISGILSHRQGRLFFRHNGVRSGTPACSTINRWVIDTTTAAGQSMAATILSAYALGKSVQIEGTNECGLWGDTESVNYVEILG